MNHTATATPVRETLLAAQALSSMPESSELLPETFEDLAHSRRQWIDNVLRPWCASAPLQQLRKAEAEWLDIAGRVDLDATLWSWAWERFPALTHSELPGVNETAEVRVELADGRVVEGFPDNRRSRHGTLVLIRGNVTGEPLEHPGISIDDVVAVTIAESSRH